MNTALSIDIGGSSTKLAIVDEAYNILQHQVIHPQKCQSVAAFFECLFQAIHPLLAEYPNTKGIGIGAPSCHEGAIVGMVNLPFSEPLKVVKVLTAQYQLPTHLIKDSGIAALGEGLFGAAKGMSNYVVLTLGTGLGCSIIINDKMVQGSYGQAGELCHSVLIPNGRNCKCGKRGCFETYVSATGLHRTAFQLMADTTLKSPLRKLSFADMTAKHIAEAAAAGDALALQIFVYTGKILGRKIAELAMIFEPTAFVLAGGLASANSLLLPSTIAQMEADLLAGFKGKIQVLGSSLPPNKAALLGAASLILRQ